MRCVRYRNKSIYRWYAGCCNASIGNTVGSGWLFIGIIHSFIKSEGELADVEGLSCVNFWVDFAAPGAPDAVRKHVLALRLLFRTLWSTLAWKVRGLNQPSAFFRVSGRPAAEPDIHTT